jgi:hypothetical protein
MDRMIDGARPPGSHPACPVILSEGLSLRAPFAAFMAWVLAVALGLAGCGGPRNFINDNDRLREENLHLKQQIDELNEQMELRLGEIEALRARAAGERAIRDADPPVLAKLQIERYTGAVDTDGDGRDDLIRIYLAPLDHQGRLFPVAGRLKLQAVAILDDSPPAVLAQRVYEPDEFDKAYRANLTGYHYTLELDLPADMDADIRSATVKATFTEAVTGHVLTAEQIVPIEAE